MISSLFKNHDNILVFDVETTGLDSKRDEIIEVAMLRVVNSEGAPIIEDEFSTLVSLTPNRGLPSIITSITGITEQQLLEGGDAKSNVCEKLVAALSCSKPLLVAYNAQFDLCFLYYFLNRFKKADVLGNIKMLDVLTIYKDRKPYPHKLSDAAFTYSLSQRNTHRALDDTRLTYELLCKMGSESDDLGHYINLFGYNPKYGVSGLKISSVNYLPQGYKRVKKLYEEYASL